MLEADVSAALMRLRAAADQANSAFPVIEWSRVEGPSEETVKQDGGGGMNGLRFEPGMRVALRCKLQTPSEVVGVPLVGDSVEAILFTLYPVEIRWNGVEIFSADGVPVAAGPCLIPIVRELHEGDNGELELTVSVPQNQATPWFNMRFTTPGLRARFERFDVAWAQLAIAHNLASTPDEVAAVSRAAALVADPLPAEESALDAALDRFAEALVPLQATIGERRIHLVGHSHIDMNWLWTWPDTVEVIKRDFRSVLSLMDDYPELTFSHSQSPTYEVIRREEPELFARVIEHIAAGRWEPLTMAWLEGDTNMASGEAHVRQLLEGVTYSRDLLGVQPTSYHAPDTFGHAGNLPQLAASAGAVRYYHHRCNPGQENQWPAYWWEGQDGTRILCISTFSYNGEILARDLAYAAIRAHKSGHKVGLHFHGIGDHGGGPSRQNLEALRRFQKMPLLPTAFCSRLDAYTHEILEDGVALPERRGESTTIFEGCYTTHADTKRYNREGENLLCTADTLSALAGRDDGAALTEGWRAVLFNQFHDILDGSAIHESYEKNRTDFEEVAATADKVVAASLDVLESELSPGAIAVTNPLGFDRKDCVVVPSMSGEGTVWLVSDSGHVTPGQYTAEGLVFVARVPAFGTVGYRVQDQAPDDAPSVSSLTAVRCGAAIESWLPEASLEAPESAPYLKLETAYFRCLVRRDCGILVSLFDKRAGRELVSFGQRRASDYIDTARPDLALNVFQVIDELPHGMSAWQYQEVNSEQSLLRGATTRVVESGPVRCVLEVQHTVRSSAITQRIVFYSDLPRIDFLADIDWKEIGSETAGVSGLKAAFTARLLDSEAWFETPFAAVRRPADGQEVPALRWADVGGADYGIAVLNDSKYGCDALGSRLRLTLLRSAYDPDAISDAGHHSIRYSLFPHSGRWQDAGVVEISAGFNQPLLARATRTVSTQSVTVVRPELTDPKSVQIACLKRAKKGPGLIVRLYESAGRAVETALVDVPAGAVVTETNVVEDPVRALPVNDGSVRLAFRPWQVRTLLIETQ